MDEHSVPDSRLEVDQRGGRSEVKTVLDLAVGGENENLEMAGKKADRLGGMGERVAMGADVGAGLEKVEETLDLCFL